MFFFISPITYHLSLITYHHHIKSSVSRRHRPTQRPLHRNGGKPTQSLREDVVVFPTKSEKYEVPGSRRWRMALCKLWKGHLPCLRVGEQDECTRTHAHIESPPHTHTCTHTCPHTHTGHPQSLGLSFKDRCVCLEKTDRVTSCTMSSSASPPRHNAPAVLRTHRRVDSEVVPSSVRP